MKETLGPGSRRVNTAEAQQLTAGLLLAYPEDQRLIKARGAFGQIARVLE